MIRDDGKSRGYIAAISLTAVVFLLRLWADGFLGNKVIFLPYFFVIIGAAALGGLWPGLLATLLSTLAGGFFLLKSGPTAPDYSQLVLFSMVGVLISVVGESFHRAKRKLSAQSQDIEAIRKRLESAESSSAMALEAGRMGTWEWQMSTDKVSWTPSMGVVFDLEESDFPRTFKDYLERLHPEDRDQVKTHLEETFRSGSPTFEGRYRINLPGGGTRWIATRGQSVFSGTQVVGLRGVCWDVSEEVEADISQARLATIVASSDDGIVSKDLDGNILTWNAGAEKIFGYSSEEIKGKSIQILLPEDRISEEQEILATLRNGQSIKNLETIRRRKDGRDINVSVTISPIFDANGTIVAVSKFIRDITDHKRAEKELESSRQLLTAKERQLQHLIDSMPVLISFVGADGAYKFVNKQYESWFGVPSSQVVGSHMSAVLGEAAYAKIEPYIAQALGGTASSYELELPYKGAGKKFVRANYVPSIGIDGEVDGFFVLVADHTEANLREQDTKFIANASSTLAEMVDYKSTLKKIAELAVPYFADWCSIDIMDEHGNLERLAVAHKDPAKVQLAKELHIKYPPDPTRDSGVPQVIRTGNPELVPVITPEIIDASTDDPEIKQIIRDLGLHSYICVPLTVKGKPIGAISFVSAEMKRSYGQNDLANAEDLARRASVSVENALLYEQLQESDRRKDEFLATLAHELRNPLAPLRTGVDILARSSQKPEVVEEVQGVMARQLTQLVRLVDDLLDVSRITTGKLELRKETVNIRELVEDAVEANRALLEQRNQSLFVNPLNDIPPVIADPTRITQVLQNLLNNAAKYTDPGGSIQVTIEHADSQVVVSVKDNGIGIDQDHLPGVFGMFSQVESALTRSHGGLGIGLALVKGLVEMHGGSVDVRSEGIGKGSEFIVRLPAVTETKMGVNMDEPKAESGSRRVLVVDDNVDVANMLGKMLSLIGNEVQTSNDGPDAIECCREFRPDVVLLDIGMPGMNGYEVARKLRQEPCGTYIKLIALTGWGSDDDKRQTKEAGFDHHLVKPVQLADLEKIL